MYTGVSIQPHWSNQRDLLVQTSQNLFSFFFLFRRPQRSSRGRGGPGQPPRTLSHPSQTGAAKAWILQRPLFT